MSLSRNDVNTERHSLIWHLRRVIDSESELDNCSCEVDLKSAKIVDSAGLHVSFANVSCS